MANNAKYYGIRWHSSIAGTPCPKPVIGRVATGYQGAINGGSNVDINIGDPVRRLSTGYFALAAGNEAAAAAAESIFGICVAVRPYYDGTRMVPSSRLPGGTAYSTNLARQSKIEVVPAAGSLWEIDCDDAATATTEAGYIALLGENADHRLTTGSEPKADPMLDISTHVTSTAQWRIEDISPTAENQDFAGLYVKLLVTVNETQQAPFVTAGI